MKEGARATPYVTAAMFVGGSVISSIGNAAEVFGCPVFSVNRLPIRVPFLFRNAAGAISFQRLSRASSLRTSSCAARALL